MKLNTRIALMLTLVLVGCGVPQVPDSYSQLDVKPNIYPEYDSVTVPVNIAPLCFHLDDTVMQCVARFSVGEEVWLVEGVDVCPKLKDWQQMTALAASLRQPIAVDIFAQSSVSSLQSLTSTLQWVRYQPLHIFVSADSIDAYISYRLISPSYVAYESLTLNQRCLENFDESLIYGNMINSDEKDGQCINCHHVQNYDPQRLQFHVRQHKGGTVIAYNGKIQKIDLRSDSTLSAGVYPAWHPTKPWIVYSTNLTGQAFHTRDIQKIEVQDTKSDLMFYDIENNELKPLTSDTTLYECFPNWSPDGKYIYYVCAEWHHTNDSITLEFDLIKRYQEVHYNLYRMPFDATTKTFGPRELVYDAERQGRSVTLPRISPDGRWLMFTEGDFGVFHIWHTSADLFLMDLQSSDTLSIRNISEINSDNVESYHSWSSNGHWVVFSSRRVDGNFTRPFIAHFDGEGHFDKPFELPQENPQFHREFLRSYNVPEFMRGPVTISPQQFAAVIRGDSVRAKLTTRP